MTTTTTKTPSAINPNGMTISSGDIRTFESVFADIMVQSKTIEQFAEMLINDPESQDVDTLHVAIRSIAQRMGCIAEMATIQIDPRNELYGGRESWLMPSFLPDRPADSEQAVQS
jgi:hypothetical protein